jgi:hypothetical protein
MGSVFLCPKVIPLSSGHCKIKYPINTLSLDSYLGLDQDQSSPKVLPTIYEGKNLLIVIIWLLLSVSLRPKVITLSSFHSTL